MGNAMIIPRMQSLPIQTGTNPWRIRLLTFLLAAIAAASAAYWALKWPDAAAPARTAVVTPTSPAVDSSKVAALLGAKSVTGDVTPAAASPTPSVYKLLGVIAQGRPGGTGQRGSALIATEGGLAKPFRVGDTVADGLVLQSVKARSVVLAPSGQTASGITLELPALPGIPAAK